jgi:hypothetical protein
MRTDHRKDFEGTDLEVGDRVLVAHRFHWQFRSPKFVWGRVVGFTKRRIMVAVNSRIEAARLGPLWEYDTVLKQPHQVFKSWPQR